MTDFGEVKISQFSPVPGKPVSKKANPKFPLASPKIFPYSISSSRGRSSAGRALDWQSRGQGFDPPRLHHRECKGLRETEGLFSYVSTPQSKVTLESTCKKLRNYLPGFVQSLLAKHNSLSNSRRQQYNSGSDRQPIHPHKPAAMRARRHNNSHNHGK